MCIRDSSLDSMAITLAAKRRSINVINFQHGVQTEDHPAFSCWKNIPLDGYEFLPTQFLCWDINSFNSMNQFFKNNKISILDENEAKKADIVVLKKISII